MVILTLKNWRDKRGFSFYTIFLSAAIILTLMPGPDNLFTLAQSLAKGKRQVSLRHLGFVQDY